MAKKAKDDNAAKRNAQDVQKDTAAPSPGIWDVPTGLAKDVIESAAILSDTPADEITLQEAAKISIGENTPKLNPIPDYMASLLWQHLTIKQLKKILQAHGTDKAEQIYTSFIGEVAQKAQKAQADTGASCGIDSAIDPASPDFDIAKWQAAMRQDNNYTATTERLQREAARTPEERKRLRQLKQFSDAESKNDLEMLRAMKTLSTPGMRIVMENTPLNETAQDIAKTAQAALSALTEYTKSDEYKAVTDSLQAVHEAMEASRGEFQEAFKELAKTADKIHRLIPFLEAELDAVKDDPEFTGCTIHHILRHGFDMRGNPTDSKYKPLIKRAQKQLAEFEKIERAAAGIETIVSVVTDEIRYPLDKPNSVIWNLIQAADSNGQISMQIDTSRKGSDQDAVIFYGLNFDRLNPDLQITRRLTPFDKRCYIAAAALYNDGVSPTNPHPVITATQIYKKMGNPQDKRPSESDLNKINDSITKMGAAQLYIDNLKEAQAVKGNYPTFKYDAPLLPFERVSAYINGKFTDAAIRLFREPPLITFARERNQITTISRRLLESPISKTDQNLALEDYLLERIAHMKSGKSKTPQKILFSTLYKNCGITNKKQMQRTPEKIKRYLEHFKSVGWIADYKMNKDGVNIIL